MKYGELKTVHLEPLIRKQSSGNIQEKQYKGMNGTKNSLKSNFKFSQQHRIVSEPSELSVRTLLQKYELNQEHKFSQEYLSLVNKLRVNLSKDYFQRKKSSRFIREKQVIYGDQNRSRVQNSSVKNQLSIINRPPQILSSRKFSNRTQGSAKKRVEFRSHPKKMEEIEKEVLNTHQSKVIQLTRLRLVNEEAQKNKNASTSLKKIRPNNIKSNKVNETELRKYKPKTTKKQKYKALKQQRRQILTQPHPQQKDDSQLNKDYNKSNELIFHIQILIQIYETLIMVQDDKSKQTFLLKHLKQYILGGKKMLSTKQSIIIDDISHLQVIYKSQPNQKDLKTMIFLERILIILIVDLCSIDKLNKYITDIKQILQNILGLYLYLICSLQQFYEDQPQCMNLQQNVSRHNIHMKKEVTPLTIFLYKKLNPLMKTNIKLMEEIKLLLSQFQNKNVSINRAFYQLLKVYAIYLNNNEHLIDRNYHVMKTFATCPSPYLTKNSERQFTLVIDLDETLVHVKEDSSRVSLFIRPFAKEFLEKMSEIFEIVVFTSSMPSHSEDIIKSLPHISHRLFRYHTTRLKSRHVKDLSRLGRPLSKTIIIDNEEQNFMMQRQNGIKILDWQGGNHIDQELNIIGLFLMKMVNDSPEDVRNYLTDYRQFRKKYV